MRSSGTRTSAKDSASKFWSELSEAMDALDATWMRPRTWLAARARRSPQAAGAVSVRDCLHRG